MAPYYPDTPLNLPDNTPIHVSVFPQTATEPVPALPADQPVRLTPPSSPRFTGEGLRRRIAEHAFSVGSPTCGILIRAAHHRPY